MYLQAYIQSDRDNLAFTLLLGYIEYHYMQTIDTQHLSACKFATLSATQLRCANTAKGIEVLLGVETLWNPKNIILDGSCDLSTDLIKPLPLLAFLPS